MALGEGAGAPSVLALMHNSSANRASSIYYRGLLREHWRLTLAANTKAVATTKEKKQSHVVLTVHVTDRVKKAAQVQKALSQFGDVIRTRIGLHEVGENFSSSSGILLLDIIGEIKAKDLQKDLNQIEGIETKLVVFKH
jgi:hypothetical protein